MTTLAMNCSQVDVTKAPCAPLYHAQSGSLIRNRFLRRLGIDSDLSNKPTFQSNPTRRLSGTCQRSRCNSFEETLKTGSDSTAIPSKEQPHRHVLYPGHNRKPSVSFSTSVTVIVIPSRLHYSDRVKRCLWLTPEEQQQQMTRNYIEFAAEGCNWREAVEEDGMVLYAGEKVHPCHLSAHLERQRYSMNNQFLHCFAQQRAQSHGFSSYSDNYGYSY